MISGNPVCSATSVTATPASRKVCADPPVDKYFNVAARQRLPQLSEARLIGYRNQRAFNGWLVCFGHVTYCFLSGVVLIKSGLSAGSFRRDDIRRPAG